MHVCMRVCMYTCMHVCVCVYVCVYVKAQAYVSVYVCALYFLFACFFDWLSWPKAPMFIQLSYPPSSDDFPTQYLRHAELHLQWCKTYHTIRERRLLRDLKPHRCSERSQELCRLCKRERKKSPSDSQGRLPHASNAVVQDNDEKDQADACEHDEPWQISQACQFRNAQRAGLDLLACFRLFAFLFRDGGPGTRIPSVLRAVRELTVDQVIDLHWQLRGDVVG